jgi:alkylhydroperoxidase family enzyme
VHHYAVKSLQEYVEKKRFRGDAMSGTRDRGMNYFRFLDRNEFECLAAMAGVDATMREVRKLDELLARTDR